jgi:hypothetical protein
MCSNIMGIYVWEVRIKNTWGIITNIKDIINI